MIATRARPLLATALAVFMTLAALAALRGLPPAASAQTSPWQPVMTGLYGDHVLQIALVGEPGSLARSMLLLPQNAGLYRYAPELGAWQPVAADSERPAALVRALTVAPGDPTESLVYAGLEGRTLLARSEDAGFTWQALPGPAGPRRLDHVVVMRSGHIHATDSGSVSVWTSTDGGETWESRPGPPTGLPIQALFGAPDDPTFYAITAGRLFRVDATPSGWQEVLGPATSPALSVAVAAAGPRGRLYAAGQVGGEALLRVSEDRGSSWPGAGWPEGGTGGATVVSAGETEMGQPQAWLGLDDGRVLRVTQGGASWELLGQVPLGVTALDYDLSVDAVWVGTGGLGLFRVGEEILQTGALPLNALALVAPNYAQDQHMFLNVEVLPERRIGTGGQTAPPLRALYESVGGDVWTRRYLTDVLGTNLLASPDFANDRLLFSGQHVSYDGGDTWRQVGPATGGDIPHVVAVGPLTATMPVVYALRVPYGDGSGGSGLLLSEYGGFFWRDADVGVDRIVDVVVSPRYQIDRRAWFITDSGAVYRAQDGLTFSAVSQIPSMARQRIVYDLTMSPDFAADNTLFVAVEDPSLSQQARVYVNTNGGAGTWRDRSVGLAARGRPRRLVLSPNFRSDGVMFLGTETRVGDDVLPGLLGSDSAGEAWYGEQNLPPSSVHGFAWLGPLRGGRLFAVAGHAGLWVRALDGPPEALATATPTVTPTDPIDPATATATPDSSPDPGTPPSPTDTPTGETPTASASPSPDVTETPDGTTPSPTPESLTETATAATSATPTRPVPALRMFLPFALRPRG